MKTPLAEQYLTLTESTTIKLSKLQIRLIRNSKNNLIHVGVTNSKTANEFDAALKLVEAGVCDFLDYKSHEKVSDDKLQRIISKWKASRSFYDLAWVRIKDPKMVDQVKNMKV